MRSYTSHKRIISLMKIMCHGTRSICIQPTVVLEGVCREAVLSKPFYSEVSQDRFMFQFDVKVRREKCNNIGNFTEIEGTGFSFRDKDDALQSAAISVLDAMLCYHGINSGQYSDILFAEVWPLYNHLSVNVKTTKAAVMQLVNEILSLSRSVVDVSLLFGNCTSDFENQSEGSNELSMIHDCATELHEIHEILSADAAQYMRSFRIECQPNRGNDHAYYSGCYSAKSDMDIHMKCNSTLRLVLSKLCERVCYSFGAVCVENLSENLYLARLTLINQSRPDEHNGLRISSLACSTICEAEHNVMYRAIWSVCRREGYRIIDQNYNDFADMERASHSIKYELPYLCVKLSELRDIMHRQLKRIEILGQKYYRDLRRHSLLGELGISLGDLISDFVHLSKSVNGELGKVETYSSNLPTRWSMTTLM